MFRLNQQGFTFLTVVFAIVMIGISLSVAAKQWSTVVQRDREEELLFRGNEIRHAVMAYYRDAAIPTPPGMPVPRNRPAVSLFPSCGMEGNDCFKDLLGDPKSHKKRYLRKAYKDPMTKDDWLMIKTADNRLMGVRSKSLKEPFKKANFPEEYKCFEEAGSYIDWVFRFVPVAAQAGGETNVIQEEPCAILDRPHKDKEDKDDKDKR